MYTGLKPTKVDPRDKHFTFHRLYGTALSYPEEYDCDAGLTMPDQNADGRPTACTAYCVTDIGTDQDETFYSIPYQLHKTFALMAVPPDHDGANARTAFSVAVSFGLLDRKKEPREVRRAGTQEKEVNPDLWPIALDSETVKKPAYLPIFPPLGKDWFDALRDAMLLGLQKKEKRSAGIALPWFYNDFDLEAGGLLPDAPTGPYFLHMPKVSGWTTRNTKGELLRNGEPFLKVKPWLGKKVGDKGWFYYSRPLVNRSLSYWGTYAATLRDVPEDTVEELKARQVTLLESALALLQNLYLRLKYGTLTL